MSNQQKFSDLVKGRYGRKIAYANYESVSAENVLDIFDKGYSAFSTNKVAVKYLWDYKNGDQPSLYRIKTVRDDINNKVVENRAYEIVQFGVAQTYGEPIQYVSCSDDEKVNTAVEKLNVIMKNAFKYQRNVKQGEWKVATGTSFLALQRTGNKNRPFRITVPTPLNTFIVYSSINDEALLAAQELKDADNNVYYLCFSDNMQYVIKDNEIKDTRLHAFGGIPIVEIPNNQDRLSDIEIVIELLDSINEMQSNRMDGVAQFVQSWIKFVNCDVDPEQFAQMKEQGALVVKSNNGENKADVDIMTQELNQSQSQVAKDDLWSSALSILAIPQKQNGSDGGSTQGAVELRGGWDFAKNRAKLKDVYVMEAENKLADIAINILRVNGTPLDITADDFDVNIPHSPQDNIVVKCQSLQYLLTAGIHPLIAIKTCGLWSDSEQTYLLSKPYLDAIYSTIDEKIATLDNANEQIAEAKRLYAEYNA